MPVKSQGDTDITSAIDEESKCIVFVTMVKRKHKTNEENEQINNY